MMARRRVCVGARRTCWNIGWLPRGGRRVRWIVVRRGGSAAAGKGGRGEVEEEVADGYVPT